MRLISIDIGIKNLAFCLFDLIENKSSYQIIEWDIVDISQEGPTPICCMKNKGNTNCLMEAKFCKNGLCYCLKHAKKQEFLIPTTDLKQQSLNKMKSKDLMQLADKYNIFNQINGSTLKKTDLITLIQKFISEKCFEPISKTNSAKIDLVTIGRNIKIKFDELFSNKEPITHVIIENQISPIANRMKTIQGMIAQYFIMNNLQVSIEFISSSNKLKLLNDKNSHKKSKLTESKKIEDINEKKTTYGERKKLGILTCLEIIEQNNHLAHWVSFFQNHKKKDDLADCFLQGVWFIKDRFM
jgi:Mitochondrial resolvase Ydc2 / RNA splicing MRS1